MEEQFITAWLAAREKAAAIGVRLELSLEALAVDKRFGALFSDEEANNALTRLLNAGYYM